MPSLGYHTDKNHRTAVKNQHSPIGAGDGFFIGCKQVWQAFFNAQGDSHVTGLVSRNRCVCFHRVRRLAPTALVWHRTTRRKLSYTRSYRLLSLRLQSVYRLVTLLAR